MKKLAFVVLAGLPMYGHHSFAAEFDEKKVVNLQGTVLQMEWVNPHTWIHVSVPNPDGTATIWMIEGNTPNSLLEGGFQQELPGGGHGSADPGLPGAQWGE